MIENIITVDLDGTLLNNANEMIGGATTRQELDAIIQRGGKLVINTGRLDHDILHLAQTADVPAEIRLSQNGAVFQNGNQLQATLMDKTEGLQVWEYLKTSPLRVELNTIDNRYWLSDRPADFVRELYASEQLVADFAPIIAYQPAVLFLLIGGEEDITVAREYIAAHFTALYPVQTSASSLEIIPCGVSKGNTLRQVFPDARIFGVGDSENDFSVFTAADYGYYIGDQTHPDAENVADIAEALGKIIEVMDK